MLVAVRRYRQSDQAFITDLRTRPGFATSSEIRDHLSAKAVLRRAGQLRPDLAKPTATDVGWRVGRSRGQDVYVSIEDSVALEGPPRSGKGYRVLISAIVDWSGPLITTSTTNDNLTATMRMRQTRGDVHVFDPQGLSGIRNPLRISPIAGCDDPLVAMQRGTAIITGTALGASTTNGEWAQASGVVLGRLLHAAAVGGKSIAELYDWGTSPAQTRDAVDILKADGAPGWGTVSTPPSAATRNSSPPSGSACKAPSHPSPSPRSATPSCHSPATRSSTRASSSTAANTLYLIGSSSGASAMGGWLGAVLDDIVEVARTTALASPGSRLTHPLGLILDEIANMFRWGNLPRIMADGGGRGICTFIVLQALSPSRNLLVPGGGRHDLGGRDRESAARRRQPRRSSPRHRIPPRHPRHPAASNGPGPPAMPGTPPASNTNAAP